MNTNVYQRQPSDVYLIPIILTCSETVGQRLGTKFDGSYFKLKKSSLFFIFFFGLKLEFIIVSEDCV